MKLLIEPSVKRDNYYDTDGIILPLEGFSVESKIFFTILEIKEIVNKFNGEVFIKINKNILNKDIEKLKDIMIELDSLNIKGIFFYDLALLQLKKELSLNVDLVWNQTHMVNNYETCNYYHSKGVSYALLGKEITLDEIIEIKKNSSIIPMVEVVSLPSVAFSRRKLITNYFHDLNIAKKDDLLIKEKVTNGYYKLLEDDNGTSFFYNNILNGTGVIKDLYDNGIDYIIIREFGIEDIFDCLIKDTKDYINNNCSSIDYVNKYKILGDYTNFFFKKTIYKVKKNG